MSSGLITFLNPNLSNSLHNKILTCTVSVILKKTSLAFFFYRVLSFTFVGYYKAHFSPPSFLGHLGMEAFRQKSKFF